MFCPARWKKITADQSKVLKNRLAFWEQVFTGGGVKLTPPSDLGPKGADRREILHGREDTSKE